jgi:hypothetical protein
MRTRVWAVLVAVTAASSLPSLHAWGGQGHRLIGLVAARHLTPVAKQNVAWLLDGQTLASVSSWADEQRTDHQQTGYWHYLNIPPNASGYDRDRDCPRQPEVAAGSRGDRWRDCAVDRILYMEQRAADRALDRADRATALKYLVHFIGDLHQPFHALGVGRGGNDVHVRVFGAANCGNDPAKPSPCNLHSVWDSRLIARRALDDLAYVAVLEKSIAERKWAAQPPGTPAEWAEQSWALGKKALVAPDSDIDDAYYRAHLPAIDERLALGAVRLAAVLNRIFVAAP